MARILLDDNVDYLGKKWRNAEYNGTSSTQCIVRCNTDLVRLTVKTVKTVRESNQSVMSLLNKAGTGRETLKSAFQKTAKNVSDPINQSNNLTDISKLTGHSTLSNILHY